MRNMPEGFVAPQGWLKMLKDFFGSVAKEELMALTALDRAQLGFALTVGNGSY